MIRSIRKQSDPDGKRMFLEAYAHLWNHPDNLPFLSSTGIPFSEDQIREWLESTEEQGRFRYFLFMDGEEIRGILVAKYDVLDGADIMGLGVHPDWKGQGLGTLLVDHAIEHARASGFKAISTSAFADNFRMQRLLLGRRFRPVAIEHGKRDDGMALVTYKRFGLDASV